MNTFNCSISFLKNTANRLYIYNFPSIDASLVIYYPFESLDINKNISNYASRLPIYDGSMNGSVSISNTKGNIILGLGDLSLNNTMGASNTPNYALSNASFNLVPSTGLSISFWFSCSGQLNTIGTIISLANIGTGFNIELNISETNNINAVYNY
jgi:hypothetical protein